MIIIQMSNTMMLTYFNYSTITEMTSHKLMKKKLLINVYVCMYISNINVMMINKRLIILLKDTESGKANNTMVSHEHERLANHV
jgi:hypothetical protein